MSRQGSVAYSEYDASESSANYPYLIFWPSTHKESYVLLLVLHGMGARSNQPAGQSGNIVDRMVHALSYRYTVTGVLGNLDLSNTESHLDEEYKRVGFFIRENFIVVAPQTEANAPKCKADFHKQSRWAQPVRLQKLLRHVISQDLKHLAVSAKVVLGISMGGAGAWNAALLGDFKAAVSVCGEGYDDLCYPLVDSSGQELEEFGEGTCNDQALNFPISRTALWAFHARNDASDKPSAGTEPVVWTAHRRLKRLEGFGFPSDHLRYNWDAGKDVSWNYFDGVWDNMEKTLHLTQTADDLTCVKQASTHDVGNRIYSSVELTSSGPSHDLWGHFLWTVVLRDVTVFEWLLSKGLSETPCKFCGDVVVPLPEVDIYPGVLPKGFHVATCVNLVYDMITLTVVEAGDIGDGHSVVLPSGSAGVVISGRPGLPTRYEVSFAVGDDAGPQTISNIPGSSLEGTVHHL